MLDMNGNYTILDLNGNYKILDMNGNYTMLDMIGNYTAGYEWQLYNTRSDNYKILE